MGLKRFIRNSIPPIWLEVLREKRLICRYVDLVYEATCGQSNHRSKEDTKFCIRRIKNNLEEKSYKDYTKDFWYSFNAIQQCDDEEYAMWLDLNNIIQTRKLLCI